MWRRSRNPLVIARAIRSPLRSRRAFVATVVPMRIHSMWLESIGSSLGNGLPSSCEGNETKWNEINSTAMTTRGTNFLQDAADRLPRCVCILVRIFGEKLDYAHLPVRAFGVHVRKCAASVNGKAESTLSATHDTVCLVPRLQGPTGNETRMAPLISFPEPIESTLMLM